MATIPGNTYKRCLDNAKIMIAAGVGGGDGGGDVVDAAAADDAEQLHQFSPARRNVMIVCHQKVAISKVDVVVVCVCCVCEPWLPPHTARPLRTLHLRGRG